MKRCIVTLTALAFTALLATAASATDIAPHGGNGGVPYRAECDPGSYVVGLDARSGAFIDRLQIVCGRWTGKTFENPRPVQTTAGDSLGGQERSVDCPTAMGVDYIVASFNHSNDLPEALLDDVGIHCAATGQVLDKPQPYALWIESPDTGGGTTHVLDFSYEEHCPPGELLTGMFGRAGQFVDSIGWICGPFTLTAPHPGTQLGRAARQRFGADRETAAAGERTVAGISVDKQIGTTSAGAAPARNQLGTVAGGVPAPQARFTPPVRFAPPKFDDGALLWACQDGRDTVCDGRAAATAWCMTRNFRGAVQNGAPRGANRGGVAVRNYLGEACKSSACTVLNEVTCFNP